MAEFKYRTRGQSSPQGKQRVYFTCHPDDFDPCFEGIVQEILSRQNCAVFYLDPHTQADEVDDYELQLSRMQLVVIPVTGALLTGESRAMDTDVRLAQKKNIPILPLMQEKGLEEQFNRRFGNLQFLDPHDADPTAIPYEQKLTRFLESVIIGDELIRQVRDAFAAVIFLSYRKKDRRYAQRLMRLIHANPLCRDIAIWYDEFLTPGENFNEAIREALDKSRLFALTVTPNLLEMPGGKPNYVMDQEYPIARDSGIPILPAEMDATDRDKLRQLYPGLPEPIGMRNVSSFEVQMRDIVRRLGIPEPVEDDPRQLYLIGLAYLTGSGVEVNHDLAFELIRKAADQDYVDAVKKLSLMYRNGEGVRRDAKQEIVWQEKLVRLYREAHEAEDSRHNYAYYAFELWALGDAYKAAGQLDKAEQAYEEMRRLSDEFSAKNDDSVSRGQVLSYGNLGDVAKKQGKLDEALEWYRKRLEVAEIIAEEAKTAVAYYDLSVSYSKFAEVALERRDYDEANEWCIKALSAMQMVRLEPGGPDPRQGLASIYFTLGDNADEQKRDAKAAEYFRQCVVYREDLAAELNTPEARSSLANAYCRYAQALYNSGERDESLKWHRKAIAIGEALIREVGTGESYDDLGVFYYNYGKQFKDIPTLKKALLIWERLYEAYPDHESFHQRIGIVKKVIAVIESYR